MAPFYCLLVVFLCLSVADAVNFTQVYNWSNGMDYEWRSEAIRRKDTTFKPEDIEPRFMAVYGGRIFLSLQKHYNIPVSLVSLPTSSASSSATPKLTAFPSWDEHDTLGGYCTKIQAARGLQVDALGRLWVLDNGSDKCYAKLLIYNLEKKDELELKHEFSFNGSTNDLVLDQTPRGYVAYIARWKQERIVVFNLTAKQSWFLYTPGIGWDGSIALAPTSNPRKLFISKNNPAELFSISVKDRTINPIGNWTASTTRMLIDSNGIMYAAFWSKHYMATWDTSQKFQEKPFHQLKDGSQDNNWPFSFALDSSGMLWMTELNKIGGKPRYRLLKAEVGASSYMFDYPPTVTRAIPTTTAISQTTKLTPVTVAERSNLSFPTTTQSSTPVEEHRLLNIILIFSNVFSVVLLSIVIIWLVLKLKRKNSLSQNTNEAQQMSVLPDEPAAYDDVGPEEVQYEEVKNDQAAARPPSPGLYEPPIRLSPRSARRVKAMPERPRTFEKFGEAPRAPLQFEYDYVRTAQPEPLYDEVKPEPSATTPFEDTTSESTQYLQLLN